VEILIADIINAKKEDVCNNVRLYEILGEIIVNKA
jgi:hypothetical protein